MGRLIGVASRFYVEQRTRAAWKSWIVERGGKKLDLIDEPGEIPLESFEELAEPFYFSLDFLESRRFLGCLGGFVSVIGDSL